MAPIVLYSGPLSMFGAKAEIAYANDLVAIICLSLFAAFVIRGLATYGQAVTLAKIGNNLVARYQRRLFDHLMRLGMGFYNDTRSGRLAAQINENVNGVRDLLSMVWGAPREIPSRHAKKAVTEANHG